jgi:hypothetical protein
MPATLFSILLLMALIAYVNGFPAPLLDAKTQAATFSLGDMSPTETMSGLAYLFDRQQTTSPSPYLNLNTTFQWPLGTVLLLGGGWLLIVLGSAFYGCMTYCQKRRNKRMMGGGDGYQG